MNRVVEILMKRDGLSEKEAKELVAETREEILANDCYGAEDIMASYLGLELDYVMEVLW